MFSASAERVLLAGEHAYILAMAIKQEGVVTDEAKKPEEAEVQEEQLEDVAGGATVVPGATDLAGAIPDVMQTPAPGGSGIPTPFPNIGAGSDIGASKKVKYSGLPGGTESAEGGSTGSTST